MTPSNPHHSFSLDNRSPLELQNFLLQFAKKLKIEEKENVEDWQAYLLKNIGFRLAYLLALDTTTIDKNIEEHHDFILDTAHFLALKAAQNEEGSLIYRIHKDFKDLVDKFLPETPELAHLKDFHHQLKINLTGSYEQILYEKGDHHPDVGLLFAFIQLFHKQLLPDLNRLPSKLTKLYYESIIRKKRAPSEPDTAVVYFEPAKFINQFKVNKGTALYAGTDANQNKIIFETEDDVHLTQAKLVDIRTLYFTRLDVEGKQGIFKRQCFSGEVYEDFETFGKNMALYKEPEEAEIADFGFAIASKLLFLNEGKRRITLRLPLPEESGVDWESTFEDNCFFEVTTAQDWVALADYSIVSTEHFVEFRLELSKEFAPIEPLPEFSPLPAIKCLLNRAYINDRVECFNRFKNFQIDLKSIELEVEVEGMQHLTCYNDLGILNVNQPFQPFGATPARYSKFIIGSAEAFQKPLDEITLQLDWDIPDWNFEDYFEAYNRPEITIRDNYQVKFNTTIGPEAAYLFDRLDEETRSSEIQSIVDLQYIVPEEWSTELPNYSPDVKWGYLEMQLVSPTHPFGTGLYQQVIARQIGRVGNDSPEQYVINPPMIPELRGIQVSYKTKPTESENRRAHLFYHIHPFGNELIDEERCGLMTSKYADAESKRNYRGVLFLGIKDLRAGLLSIYFEQAGSSLIPSNSETQVSTPSFFIVRGNRFLPVTKVTDSTEGFEQSGIIKLSIEASVLSKSRSTLLPRDKYWIAVVVEDNVESFGVTKRINLHGTAARRVTDITMRSRDHKKVMLPGGSIVRTLEDVPAVKEVLQPNSSFSGRVKESGADFTERVATEIRHRYRPTKERDLEAIIREAFPNVNFCRVYSWGHQLRVVIVPYRQQNTLRPAFAVSFLDKVRVFVKHLVSPFLTVIVENPHYAVLQAHISLESKSLLNNEGEVEYQLKRRLIEQYLSPWESEVTPIGRIPDFNGLNFKIANDYQGLKIRDYIFYYYYFTSGRRQFHYFKQNRANGILSKNVIFVADLDQENHHLFFDHQRWQDYVFELEDREADGTVINGFQVPFDEIVI